MRELIFVRLDADNIGDSIELALLKEDSESAQKIHNKVQSAINQLIETILNRSNCSVLLQGADDILFSISESNFDLTFVEELRGIFYQNTGFTISVGVGNSITKCNENLRIAKLSGKNRTISY